jgi:hypothetical protein
MIALTVLLTETYSDYAGGAEYSLSKTKKHLSDRPLSVLGIARCYSPVAQLHKKKKRLSLSHPPPIPTPKNKEAIVLPGSFWP